MKIKDLTPLTVVYLHRRGEHGSRSKAVVLDTALWSRSTYSASRTIVRAYKGARAEDSSFGHTTGLLVLFGREETSDKALLDLAAQLVLDEIAESVDQVEDKHRTELDDAKAHIAVALPTRLQSTWADYVEHDKAQRAYQAEQNRAERERQSIEAKQRTRVNDLARQFGVPLKLDSWDRKATLSMPDMIALLERLGAAEDKL